MNEDGFISLFPFHDRVGVGITLLLFPEGKRENEVYHTKMPILGCELFNCAQVVRTGFHGSPNLLFKVLVFAMSYQP